MRLTWRFIKRDKKTTGNVILGITISVMLLFSVIQIGRGFLSCYQNALMQGKVYDMMLKNLTRKQWKSAVSYGLANDFQGSFFYFELGSTYVDDNKIPFHVSGYSGNLEEMDGVSVVRGRLPIQPGELCMEESANRMLVHPYEIEDKITLSVYDAGDGEGRNKKLHTVHGKIVGFVTDYPAEGNYILLPQFWSWRLLNKWGKAKDVYSYLQIWVDSYCDKETNEKLTGAYYYLLKHLWPDKSMAEAAKNVEWNPRRQAVYQDRGRYFSLADAMWGLSAVLVLCTILFIYGKFYGIYLRRAEIYGMLRCIGMDRNRVVHLLLKEALLLCVPGLILGFLLGNLLNQAIARQVVYGLLGSGSDLALEQRAQDYFLVVLLLLIAVGTGLLLVWQSIRKIPPIQEMCPGDVEAPGGSGSRKKSCSRLQWIMSAGCTVICAMLLNMAGMAYGGQDTGRLAGMAILGGYVLLLLLLAAAAAIGNVIRFSCLYQRREYGVIRVLGMEEKEQLRFLAWKNTCRSLKGAVIGGALATLINIYLWEMIGGTKAFPILPQLISVLFVALYSFGIGRVALMHCLKGNIAEMLYSE